MPRSSTWRRATSLPTPNGRARRASTPPGARYSHADGRCSFETLIDEFDITDLAVQQMARVVHGADIAEHRNATPQSAGLIAIADGFALLDIVDQRQLQLEL